MRLKELKYFITVFLFCIFINLNAQDTNVINIPVHGALGVDKMPQYPGGLESMYEYLSENIVYPALALEEGVMGRVVVKFIVEKDGSLSGIDVVREVGYGCDKESVRVVKNMPKWAPGEHLGKKIRVQYALPIRFETYFPDAKTTKKWKKRYREWKLLTPGVSICSNITFLVNDNGEAYDIKYNGCEISEYNIKGLLSQVGNFKQRKIKGKQVRVKIYLNSMD